MGIDENINIGRELQNRISELEEMLADCERDYRLQVDKAVELHKENARLRDVFEKYADHEPDCSFFDYADNCDCDCGYKEIAQQALEGRE